MQAYNEVLLEGVPTGTPERSHENHGQVFYRQFIEVPRLSGTADLLPMLLRQEQLAGVHSGEPLRIDGQLRSFNNRTVTGRRLILTVYGKALLPPTGEAVNQIILSGTLCKPPCLPSDTAGPQHLRSAAGRSPELWACGLSAGHRVGPDRPADQCP